MKFRKRSMTWALLLASALFLTACGTPSSSGAGSRAGTKSPVIIGVDDNLSGPLAYYGSWTLKNVQAAAAYENAHGGINGHPVKIVAADMSAAGANASSAAAQLISVDHASLIYGLTLSNDCAAVAVLAAARKVPEICDSVSPNDMSPVHPYVFGAGVEEFQEAPSMATFIKNTLKVKAGSKVASITCGATGCEDLATAVDNALTKDGYKVVARQIVPLSAVNASTQISNIVASRPAVVVGEPIGPDIEALVAALRAAGNNAPVVIADDEVSYPALMSMADPHVYSVHVAKIISNVDPKAAGAALAVKALKLVGVTGVANINQGTGPEEFPPVWAALQALKSCDACSGAKFVKALESVRISLPGLMAGKFGWSKTLHLPYKDEYFYHYDASTKLPQEVGKPLPLGPVKK
jgi:branched-chain amino acid transport system substrate-binding protein